MKTDAVGTQFGPQEKDQAAARPVANDRLCLPDARQELRFRQANRLRCFIGLKSCQSPTCSNHVGAHDVRSI